MKVELIAYTKPIHGDNPVDVVEQCASVCYDSKPTKSHAIAKSCMASGHRSVWEHISFTFHIQDASRALLAQLSRHRHISLSVRSQRYCSESEFECVNPFHNGTIQRDMFVDDLVTIRDMYNKYLELGMKREDARMILPNACCTELYMTANARALVEISHLRLCNRAQKEIRTMFMEIKREVAKVCPEVSKYMVPKCEEDPAHPFCTEEKCCGRHKKLSEVYHETE